MPNYVVLSGEEVVNIIDAPTIGVAEKATGLVCVEYDYVVHPEVGDKFVKGIFVKKPKPIILNSEA